MGIPMDIGMGAPWAGSRHSLRPTQADGPSFAILPRRTYAACVHGPAFLTTDLFTQVRRTDLVHDIRNLRTVPEITAGSGEPTPVRSLAVWAPGLVRLTLLRRRRREPALPLLKELIHSLDELPYVPMALTNVFDLLSREHCPPALVFAAVSPHLDRQP